MSQMNAPPKVNAPQLWDWFEKAPNHVVTCHRCREEVVRRDYASTPLGATFLRQELWKHLKWRHHTEYLITGHRPEHPVKSTRFPYVTRFAMKLRSQRKRKTLKKRAIAQVQESVSQPAASAQPAGNVKFAFTADQRLALSEVFSKTTYPSVAQRTQLAQQFNVREKSIANWFQQRRNSEWKKAGPSQLASSPVVAAEKAVVEGRCLDKEDAKIHTTDRVLGETDGPTQMDDSFEEEL